MEYLLIVLILVLVRLGHSHLLWSGFECITGYLDAALTSAVAQWFSRFIIISSAQIIFLFPCSLLYRKQLIPKHLPHTISIKSGSPMNNGHDCQPRSHGIMGRRFPDWGLLRCRKWVPKQLGDVIVVTKSLPIGHMRSQLTNHQVGFVLAVRAWS